MQFSVIIPCFNASSTIYRCLISVENQSHKPSEIIIIDDASDDFKDTLKIINHFKNKMPIKLIRNKINRNGAFSRNVGIDQSFGDYLAFLDSDDTWENDRLESAKNLIEQLPDQKFIIYGKFDLVMSSIQSVSLPLRGIKLGELVTEYVFAAGQQMQTSTFLCPAKIAKKIKFDPNLSRHQDSDFMMRAQANGISLIFQNKKCASYFFSKDDMKSRLKSNRINIEFCNNWLSSKSKFFNSKAIAGYKVSVYARVLYLQGDKIKALAMICKAFYKIGFGNFYDLTNMKLRIFSFNFFKFLK